MLKGDSWLARGHLEIYTPSLMKFFETTIADWNKETHISRSVYISVALNIYYVQCESVKYM